MNILRLFSASIILFGVTIGGLQVPAHVQAAGQNFVQGASVTTGSKVRFTTLALTHAIPTGDFLVGTFSEYDSSGQVHVSDNVNGGWTRATGETFDASGDVAIYYKENSAAAPAGVTITISADNSTYLQGSVSEYTGIPLVNSFSNGVCSKGVSASADSGPTASASQGAVVFGGLQTGGNPHGFTAGSSQGINFVTRTSSPSGVSGAEDILSSNAGAQDARFSLNSATNWKACAAVFNSTASSAINFVQSQALSPGTQAANETISFSNPVKSGDLLVGWFGQFNASGQVHVSDNVNGGWTRGPSETFSNGGGDIAMYYKLNSAPSTSLVITVSANSATYLPYAVSEYSGVSSLDQTAVAFQPGSANSSQVVSGPTGSVGANELVFGAQLTGGIPASFSVGSSQGVSFAKRSTNFDSGSAGAEDILSSLAGTQTSNFTLSSPTDWYSVVAVFKP